MALFNSQVNILDEQLKLKTLEKIIDSVEATMAFEGLKASPEALEIGRRYLDGEISSSEAVELIKGLHKAKRLDEISIKPKVENGKVLLDRDNVDHRYIMEEE